MYESYWDKKLKQPRSRSVESFGYVDELICDDIKDPIAYYQDVVNKKEEERKKLFDEENRPRCFKETIEKNAGYFLLSCLIDELKVKEDIDILASVKNYQFSVYEMINQLIYARIIDPCSKSKTVSAVFPRLYKYSDISEDQIYDGLEFVGENYKKYIELFNHQYEKQRLNNQGIRDNSPEYESGEILNTDTNGKREITPLAESQEQIVEPMERGGSVVVAIVLEDSHDAPAKANNVLKVALQKQGRL